MVIIYRRICTKDTIMKLHETKVIMWPVHTNSYYFVFGLLVCLILTGCTELAQETRPSNREVLTTALPKEGTQIVSFQEVDNNFAVLTYSHTSALYRYPDLGCVIGANYPFRGMGQGDSRVSTMNTYWLTETQDLPAQPMVVLQDYFYGHHVACIFLTEAGRALGGATLELTDRYGQTEEWQFVRDQAVIIADGATSPDIAPFTKYTLLERDGRVVYSTDYIDGSFQRSYYQQFGRGVPSPTIRTVTPRQLEAEEE